MSTLRRGTLIVLVLLLALLAPAAAGAQDGDPFGVRLLEIPADRADDPRAQSWVVDHVAPGDAIERRFEVINGGDGTVEVDLYATLAEIQGDTFTAANGREQNELAGWITVTPAEMTLGPGENAEASLRIDVPADASEGERYAAVFAERAAAQDVAAGSVGVAARVGIRVYLSVGAGGEPATDFQITAFTAGTRDDGVRVVQAAVENTGGRALDFSGDLNLSEGPGGLSAGPFEVSPGTTLGVGETVDLEVVLDASIPAGPWQADLMLTSGTLVREASTQLTFPEEAGAAGDPVVVEETTGGGDNGVAIGLGLLLLALLIAAALWLLRRRRGTGTGDAHASTSPESAAPEPAAPDTSATPAPSAAPAPPTSQPPMAPPAPAQPSPAPASPASPAPASPAPAPPPTAPPAPAPPAPAPPPAGSAPPPPPPGAGRAAPPPPPPPA